MTDWVRAFLERRRTEPPRDDVVDAVLAADIDGRAITEKEAIGTVQLLIFGGLDTTAGALGHILIRFCRQPEIPALLRARPELLDDAIEELVRLDSPLVFMGRTATRDVEVGGRTINAGDKILISFLSANYDEAEFDDAASFDLERARNRQIAFGAGVHRCAGSNLARHNLRIALSEILHRLDDIRLQDGAEPLRLHSSFARAPDAVPIAFTPSTRVGALTQRR
jgi:cytochrome P450